MDITAAETLPAGATVQMTALAAALGGALLAAGLLLLWQRLRLPPAVLPPGDSTSAPPAETTSDLPAVARLLAGALVACLVLPTAAVVRQLWPVPDLGPRLLVGWLLVLIPVVLAWTALAIAGGKPWRPGR
jgi:hypothetical protein